MISQFFRNFKASSSKFTWFPFPVIASHPKFVKLLQAQVWPNFFNPNFHWFLLLFHKMFIATFTEKIVSEKQGYLWIVKFFFKEKISSFLVRKKRWWHVRFLPSCTSVICHTLTKSKNCSRLNFWIYTSFVQVHDRAHDLPRHFQTKKGFLSPPYSTLNSNSHLAI